MLILGRSVNRHTQENHLAFLRYSTHRSWSKMIAARPRPITSDAHANRARWRGDAQSRQSSSHSAPGQRVWMVAFVIVSTRPLRAYNPCELSMKRAKPLSVSVCIGLLFALWCMGCRTLDGKMQRQVGQPRDKLIEKFGPPERDIRLMDGRTVLWFHTGVCRVIFHLNREGIVTSASAHDCVGVCLGPYCW